jgi:hypothetical protein
MRLMFFPKEKSSFSNSCADPFCLCFQALAFGGVRPEQVELVNGEFFVAVLWDGKESFTIRDEGDIFRFGIEESPSISRASWPPESGSISRHRELPA